MSSHPALFVTCWMWWWRLERQTLSDRCYSDKCCSN